MPKFKKFTKEELETLHLTILREIGRQIGVRAPAAKNKETLAANIISIQSGKIKPVEQRKFGAPPKIKPDVSEFYAKENYKEYNCR